MKSFLRRMVKVFSISLIFLFRSDVIVDKPNQFLNAGESTVDPALDAIQKNKFAFLQTKWDSYMESWCSLSGEYNIRSIRNGEVVKDSQMEFVASYPELLEESKTSDEEHYVVVKSKKYAFTLRNTPKDGHLTEEYEILQLEPRRELPQIEKWKFPFLVQHDEMYDLQNPAYSVYLYLAGGLRTFSLCYSLPALLAQEDLIVNKLEWGEYNSQRALHIDFLFQIKGEKLGNDAESEIDQNDDTKNQGIIYSVAGDVWLDSEFYLMLHGEFIEKRRDSISERRIDCAYRSLNGTPIPTAIRWSNAIGEAEKVFSEEFYNYDNMPKTTSQDEERFKLSHYGLPEPKLNDDASSIRYFMMILGGVIILLALFFMIKRARKEQVA